MLTLKELKNKLHHIQREIYNETNKVQHELKSKMISMWRKLGIEVVELIFRDETCTQYMMKIKINGYIFEIDHVDCNIHNIPVYYYTKVFVKAQNRVLMAKIQVVRLGYQFTGMFILDPECTLFKESMLQITSLSNAQEIKSFFETYKSQFETLNRNISMITSNINQIRIHYENSHILQDKENVTLILLDHRLNSNSVLNKIDKNVIINICKLVLKDYMSFE